MAAQTLHQRLSSPGSGSTITWLRIGTPEHFAACRGQIGGQEQGTGSGAVADRARRSARARSCASAPTRAPIEVETISTGSLGLDIALGVGGLPRGRVIEIYGPESSGKTTLALHAVAEAQKTGGICAFVDAEHALDPIYARKLGVELDELLISQPDTGEQALEIADTLVRSGAIDVLVIDSVAALTPRAEIEGEMGDSHAGPAGPPDEPGAAQADRLDLELRTPWSSSSTRSA